MRLAGKCYPIVARGKSERGQLAALGRPSREKAAVGRDLL